MTTKPQFFEVRPGCITSEKCLDPVLMFGYGSAIGKLYAATTKHKKRVTGPVGGRIEGMTPRLVRDFRLCEIDDGKRISYLWADAKTGTLYRARDGACLTSANLRLV